MKLEITDKRIVKDRTCYFCGEHLIFSTTTEVPPFIQMTQEQWDYWRQECAERRVKQGWIGNDITNPIKWEF
jgi:hypothetical protein